MCDSGGEATPSMPVGRIPRVSRLMALAIRLDQLIRDEVVSDQAELARLGHVSRARLTQIMNLLALNPGLQGRILDGKLSCGERRLRQVAAKPEWEHQQSIVMHCCRPIRYA